MEPPRGISCPFSIILFCASSSGAFSPKEAVDAFCRVDIHGGAGREAFYVRGPDVVDVLKFFHQCLFPHCSDSGDLIQEGADLCFFPEGTVIFDREAVHLVLDPCEKAKYLPALRGSSLPW